RCGFFAFLLRLVYDFFAVKVYPTLISISDKVARSVIERNNPLRRWMMRAHREPMEVPGAM
ncbi:MAG: hypothetical protein OEU26_30560, partial [Candidatus Tectomicrobia bacterium]|nr:hypothetical protein [Candidatus Tectomicrobia bacterium]